MYDQDHCSWRSKKKQKTVNRILARLYDSKSVLLATSTGAWK